MIPPIPMPPPNYEQTIEALVDCGVRAAAIRISYEDELQSDVITIADVGGTDEARFACVRGAVHPFYILQIENPAQRNAFYSFASREDRSALRAEAIEWLRSSGMLDRVPRYDPAQGAAAFAHAVETACGLPPDSALQAFNESTLTFRREYLQRSLAASEYEGTACLMRMIAASNAEDHGISLAFIGNEAFQDSQP